MIYVVSFFTFLIPTEYLVWSSNHCGVILGLAFSGLEAGQFLTRISLFITSYICCNLWLIEIAPALHTEKIIYYRERHAKATTPFATWVSKEIPLAIASLIFTLCYCVPIYYISGLRSGFVHFLNFYFILYLSVISNLVLQNLIANCTPNTAIHTLLYPGLLIPVKVCTL